MEKLLPELNSVRDWDPDGIEMEIGPGTGIGIGPVIKCVSGASLSCCLSPCHLTRSHSFAWPLLLMLLT